MPTPMPAPSSSGLAKAGAAAADAERQAAIVATSIAAPSRSMPLAPPRGRDPVAEQDVEDEQHAVGEGEDIAQRLARDPHFGQHVNAGDREGEGRQVAAGAQAEGGDSDRAEKLDRTHGRERQPGDRLVEDRVHGREHDPERHDDATVPRAAGRPGSARAGARARTPHPRSRCAARRRRVVRCRRTAAPRRTGRDSGRRR